MYGKAASDEAMGVDRGKYGGNAEYGHLNGWGSRIRIMACWCLGINSGLRAGDGQNMQSSP